MEKVKVISLKPISNSNDVEEKSFRSCKITNGNIKWSKSSFTARGSSFSVSGDKLSFSKKNSLSLTEGEKSSVQLKKDLLFSDGHNSRVSNVTKIPSNFFPVPTNCFGRSDYRASYNERINTVPSSIKHLEGQSNESRIAREAKNNTLYVKSSGLYRSNSSLELDRDVEVSKSNSSALLVKREYGSHGSININSALHPESVYALLQSCQQQTSAIHLNLETSPKGRLKLQKLWDKDKSIFKKLLPYKMTDIKLENKTDNLPNGSDIGIVISNSNAKHPETMANETKHTDSNSNSSSKSTRRVAIAHYDCQSLAFQLNPARLKVLLADRSNTITGASAAASVDLESQRNVDEIVISDVDHTDEKSNCLVSSCPFFHNEIGGEGERIVSLSREVTHHSGVVPNALHLYRSSLASSIGLLEPSPGSSYWSSTLCPYIKKQPRIEAVDQGAAFYSAYFLSQEHQNWFGVDDQMGPVAISVKREKVEEQGFDNGHSLPTYQYRFILRTSELCSCQGTIREETANNRGDKNKGHGHREVIEYVWPQLSLACLRLGINAPETEAALIKLDELGIHKKFKVGVLYCRSGQNTEEDMYNNEHSGPAFSEFLEILGQRVRLKNFDKYRGGLDKKTDSTGNYSVYAQYQENEIMFHISTLLPFTTNNRKQLLRKRHIGNDIVTIIFQEPGALPFSPKNIRSHFQHVFIIVQAINPCTENTMYSVAVSRFQDVPMFGPPIPEGGTFPKLKHFTNFLLAKVINGELAALRSEKFACMAARTKHEYLKDLAENHSSSTLLDTSSKFSLIGFSRSSKKEKSRFKFVADSSVKGALSWSVSVDDATTQKKIDCILAISTDSLVLLEESSASIIFSTSCKSVLGWSVKLKQGIRLFYHQGECLSIDVRLGTPENECEEIMSEIVSRLSAVTQGAEGQELILRRNSVGLLGFNVQQDGIITEVEPFGLAAQSHLEPGARLVEICTIALATLTQEQMVDLLKTSVTVTVVVIPPHADGTPRRGCNVPTCGFLLGCSEGDYENLTPPDKPSSCNYKTRIFHMKRCDRSLSPPRSGCSSGYGTGSSSQSFSMELASKSHHGFQDLPYHVEEMSKVNMEGLSSQESVESLSRASSGHSIEIFSDEICNHPGAFYNSNLVSNHHSMVHQYSSFAPPPLPARVYRNDSPFSKRSLLEPTYAFESGNYAVPLPLPRPVKGRKASDAFCDYDNVQLLTPRKHNNRRNSSPNVLDPKEESDDSASRESIMKSRNSIPKSVNPDEKYSEDCGALHSFQKVISSGPTSSSSSSHSAHTQSSQSTSSSHCKAEPVLRLKLGAHNGKNSSSRNSTTSQSSNLQEELLKLINPDYLSNSEVETAEDGVDMKDILGDDLEGKSNCQMSLSSSSTSVTLTEGATECNLRCTPCENEIPAFKTIGEVEFSNRKSVFTSTERKTDSQEAATPPIIHGAATKNEKLSKSIITDEGVVLTARPATVISNSSATSSPANIDPKQIISGVCHNKEWTQVKARTPTAKTSLHPTAEKAIETGKLPSKSQPGVVGDDINEEWDSLVTTATRAIENGDDILACSTLKKERPSEEHTNKVVTLSLSNNSNLVSSASSAEEVYFDSLNYNLPSQCYSNQFLTNSCNPSTEASNANLTDASLMCPAADETIEERLQQLERALTVEQQRSGKLLEEVSYLRSENRKLQDDSRAAAHQLHQFTEWFFTTIDKG